MNLQLADFEAQDRPQPTLHLPDTMHRSDSKLHEQFQETPHQVNQHEPLDQIARISCFSLWTRVFSSHVVLLIREESAVIFTDGGCVHSRGRLKHRRPITRIHLIVQEVLLLILQVWFPTESLENIDLYE